MIMHKLNRLLAAICCITMLFAVSCEKTPGNLPEDNTEQNGNGPGDKPEDPTPEPEPDPEPEPKPEPDPVIEVVDPGETPDDGQTFTPQHPELLHEVEYDEFFNPVQDWLDLYENIDYVCSQGNGAAWPIVLDNGHIRFYQGSNANKGGSYIRIRSHNGAVLRSVTVGTASKTVLAHSLDGKAAKSDNTSLEAGEQYVINAAENCSQVCIYCMGTDQSLRWEMDYIKVEYQGGFVESDFHQSAREYGPLVRVSFPFTETFEDGFPTTDKPSYYKYGITAGRENLQWSTWYGSFSWQNPIEGGQSAQLRIYQEEEDYDMEQFGHLKMEFFLEGLSKVSFRYYMSEFWIKATISYCEFGDTRWSNPQQIALSSYSQRQTVQDFTYVLDGGARHNAKIRIALDPATGFPSSSHYDFLCDSFVFE